MIPFLAPMAGFLNPVGNFLKRIPDWVIWLLAAIVLLKFVDMRAEHRGKEKQKDKNALDNAREHARTVETVNRIGQETENAKDRAIAAPSTVPDVSSADELREQAPDIAAVILRPRRTGGGEGNL